jgi:hypothetical protein
MHARMAAQAFTLFLMGPEISVRESYMHLYFKDVPKESVEKMLRDEHQVSAALHRKKVAWDAPEMAPIRLLHRLRRKPLEPKR